MGGGVLPQLPPGGWSRLTPQDSVPASFFLALAVPPVKPCRLFGPTKECDPHPLLGRKTSISTGGVTLGDADLPQASMERPPAPTCGSAAVCASPVPSKGSQGNCTRSPNPPRGRVASCLTPSFQTSEVSSALYCCCPTAGFCAQKIQESKRKTNAPIKHQNRGRYHRFFVSSCTFVHTF